LVSDTRDGHRKKVFEKRRAEETIWTGEGLKISGG
jgi:hypothetical protein